MKVPLWTSLVLQGLEVRHEPYLHTSSEWYAANGVRVASSVAFQESPNRLVSRNIRASKCYAD